MASTRQQGADEADAAARIRATTSSCLLVIPIARSVG